MTERAERENARIAVGNGIVVSPEPADFGSYVSQTLATGTVTFSSTFAETDVITLTLTSKQFASGSYALNFTCGGSETPTTVATAFKNAINADPLLASMGIVATSSGAALTLKCPGPLGNFVTTAFSKSAGSGAAAVVQTKGGAGYVIPKVDARVACNGWVLKLIANQPIQVDYAQCKAILDANIALK